MAVKVRNIQEITNSSGVIDKFKLYRIIEYNSRV